MRVLHTTEEIKRVFQQLVKPYFLEREVEIFTPLVGIPQFFTRKHQRRVIAFIISMIVPTIFGTGYLLIFNSLYAIPLLALLLVFQLPLELNIRFLSISSEYGIIIPRLTIFQGRTLEGTVKHELKHLLRYLKNSK